MTTPPPSSVARVATRFFVPFSRHGQWSSWELYPSVGEGHTDLPVDDFDCDTALVPHSTDLLGRSWPMQAVLGYRMGPTEPRFARDLRVGGGPASRPHYFGGESGQLPLALLVGAHLPEAHGAPLEAPAPLGLGSLWATGALTHRGLGLVEGIRGKLEAFLTHADEHPGPTHLFVLPQGSDPALADHPRRSDFTHWTAGPGQLDQVLRSLGGGAHVLELSHELRVFHELVAWLRSRAGRARLNVSRLELPCLLGYTPMQRDEGLVGRDATLEALEAHFEQDGGTLVLHGPPGVGKSALARALVARQRRAWEGQREATFEAVLWSDIQTEPDPAQARQAMAMSLLQALRGQLGQVADPKQILDRARARGVTLDAQLIDELEAHLTGRRVLWVLNNVEGAGWLEWLRGCAGRLTGVQMLLTTRQEPAPEQPALRVETLSNEDAAALLLDGWCDVPSPDQRERARQIAGQVGELPLVLVQLRIHLMELDRRWHDAPLALVWGRLTDESHGEELLGAVDAIFEELQNRFTLEEVRSMAAVFEVIYEGLDSDETRAAAHLLAYLAPAPLPRVLLGGQEGLDRGGLMQLCQRNVLQRARERHLLGEMHRLQASFLRSRDTPQDRQDHLARALDILGARLDAGASDMRVRRLLATHTQSVLRHAPLGPEHPDTLITMHNLAGVLRDQGEYNQAQELFEQVLELRQRPEVLGPEHPSTLTTMHNLAGVLRHQGEYDQARELFEQVLEVEQRPEVLGPEHPSTLTTMHNLAGVLQDQGEYDQARELYEQVLEVEQRPEVLGPEHPSTLTTMNNLAGVLRHQGEYDQARELYEQVLEVEQRPEVLGPEHPSTLTTMNNLAGVLRDQGEYDQARELYEQVLELRQRPEVLGPEHPDTLTTMNNLAGVLRHQGEYDQARELYEQVLELRQRPEVLGPEHPSTLTTMHNLAGVLRDQGEYDQARELYEQVLEVKQRPEVLGPEHPSTLTTMHNLAGVLRHQGEYEQARELFEQVLEVEQRPEVLGPEHPSTLTTMHNLAGVLRDQGEYDQARELFEQVLELRQRPEVLGPEHPDTLETMRALVEVWREQGEEQRASALAARVCELESRRGSS